MTNTNTKKPSNEDAVREVVDKLLTVSYEVPDPLAEKIRALGSAAGPRLLEICLDGKLREDDAPGEGYAPLHALELLVDLQFIDAIEPLIGLMFKLEPITLLRDRLSSLISCFGAAALEALLEEYERLADYEDKKSCLRLLSDLQVRDPRIFALLQETFKRDAGQGIELLVTYGDPAAVPLLVNEAGRLTPDNDYETSFRARSIQRALEKLGHEVPDELSAHLVACQRLGKAPLRRPGPREAQLVSRTPKVGRNEPCPCGSGKKYKRCCIAVTAP